MKVNKWKKLYVAQGNYGYGDGWEDLLPSFNWKEARDAVKDHRVNEPQYQFRWITRRVINPEWEAQQTPRLPSEPEYLEPQSHIGE